MIYKRVVSVLMVILLCFIQYWFFTALKEVPKIVILVCTAIVMGVSFFRVSGLVFKIYFSVLFLTYAFVYAENLRVWLLNDVFVMHGYYIVDVLIGLVISFLSFLTLPGQDKVLNRALTSLLFIASFINLIIT